MIAKREDPFQAPGIAYIGILRDSEQIKSEPSVDEETTSKLRSALEHTLDTAHAQKKSAGGQKARLAEESRGQHLDGV